MKKVTEARLVIISEIFFITLPIIVIALVFLFHSNIKSLFTSPDISFANIVLFGQTIVRLASGTAKERSIKSWQVIALIISTIIVFGLIPSVLVLVIILVKTCVDNIFIYITQFFYFIVSISCYTFLGTVGQILLDSNEKLNIKQD